jgi:hypothetical protein
LFQFDFPDVETNASANMQSPAIPLLSVLNLLSLASWADLYKDVSEMEFLNGIFSLGFWP